jgi:hypothetical protein
VLLAVKETDPPLEVVLESLTVGGMPSRVEALLVKLDQVNRVRKESDDPPCDGVLGAPFLKEHAAVIDYGAMKLFLRDPTHPAAPTGAAQERCRALRDAGYVELPLAIWGKGQPVVKGDLNGEQGEWVVDTAAQKCTIDTAAAGRLKLRLQDVPGHFTHLLDGSRQPLQYATLERFAIGGIPVQTDGVLMDMSAMNTLRNGEGYPPLTGLLGADALHRLAAVIDYPAAKLFVLDRGRKPQNP